MEREYMRRVLAERGMGWFLLVEYDDFFEYDEPVWFKTRKGNYAICSASEWRPDEKPGQMMAVVYAMREKGWKCVLEDNPFTGRKTAWCSNVAMVDDGDDVREYYATDESECKARMLAAARALEAKL